MKHLSVLLTILLLSAFCFGQITSTSSTGSLAITTVTGNYAATATDQLLIVNCSAACTTTMPPIGATSQTIRIKRIDATAATLTLIPSGANTIEGATSVGIAAGGTGGTYISNPATGIWRLVSTYIPGSIHALYYSGITIKGGDTLSNPTTRTAFASKYTVPANYLSVGQLVEIEGFGRYQVPTGAVSPTANAQVQFGSSVLIGTGNLTVGLGTGVNYGFKFKVLLIVRSIGSSCQLYPVGDLTFQLTGGGAPTQAGIIPDTSVVTANCTIDNDLQLTLQTSNNAGQVFTVDSFMVRTTKKPSAAN